jgi:hypothetical protein
VPSDSVVSALYFLVVSAVFPPPHGESETRKLCPVTRGFADPMGDPPAVCVTGSTGYVGSWLVRTLLRRGYRVHATARDTGTRWTACACHLPLLHGWVMSLSVCQARRGRCWAPWKGGTDFGCSGRTWARTGASTTPSGDAWRSSMSRPPWTSTYHRRVRTTSVSCYGGLGPVLNPMCVCLSVYIHGDD